MYEFRTQLKTGETLGRDTFCPLFVSAAVVDAQYQRRSVKGVGKEGGTPFPPVYQQEMSKGSFSFTFTCGTWFEAGDGDCD